MSKPGLKGFKYGFRRDVVDYAMPSESDVEIGGYSTGENVPMEVIGGSIGSDQVDKVVEGSGRIIDWVDVNDYNEIYGSIWVKSCFKLVGTVYEFDDFCSYGGVHVVRV